MSQQSFHIPEANEALASTTLDGLVSRGLIEEIIVRDELNQAIESGNKLTIYQGFDPTSPSLHLGHYLSLRILRWFQLNGHRVIFLVGDFTARIGDPSEQTAERKQLSKDQVVSNTSNWLNQISRVLDLQETNPVEIKYNSEWLSKLSLEDIMNLSSQITVQRLIERDMFQKRIQENKPLHMHETLYPILQGYDSVAMNVDIELGGRDQMFNMLVGRDFVRTTHKHAKHVLMTPLIPGLDGRKMSKTYNNTVDLDERPAEMYFKLTQINDELLPLFFSIFTDIPDDELEDISKKINSKEEMRPDRSRLSYEIVKVFHGEEVANNARREFNRVIAQGEQREDLLEISVPVQEEFSILELCILSNQLSSKGDARRLIKQGAIEIDGEKYTDPNKTVLSSTIQGKVIKIGNRGYFKFK
ncbi:MAG: tyrosine--tRNA ligase [Dehalococcoidia bacterium]